MSRQLPIWKVYHLIKYRIIKYPLTTKNYRKYCIYLKIMSLLFHKYFLIPASIITTIFHVFIFGSYPRNGYEICSIFGQILGNIQYFSGFYFIAAYSMVGAFLWLSSTQYLKYKFEEINTKIELSLKQMNIRLLMNAIHEHNYVERLTRDINDLFSRIIFIIYYLLTLTSQLLLYIAQRKDTFLSISVVAHLVALGYMLVILIMNITCGQLRFLAHKSYPTLFAFMVNQNNRMSLKQNLKLRSFMEKLSGPQIGFYCYDLFAMNSNRFYHYLCIYITNYILIVNLFS